MPSGNKIKYLDVCDAQWVLVSVSGGLNVTFYGRQEGTVGRKDSLWARLLPLPAFFSHFCNFGTHFLAGHIRGHICGNILK